MDYANFLLASLPQKNQDSSCIDSSLTSGSYSRSYSSSTTPCKDLHQSTYGSEFNSTSMAILAFALGPEALELCLQPREEGRRRAPHQSRPSFNIYTYIYRNMQWMTSLWNPSSVFVSCLHCSSHLWIKGIVGYCPRIFCHLLSYRKREALKFFLEVCGISIQLKIEILHLFEVNRLHYFFNHYIIVCFFRMNKEKTQKLKKLTKQEKEEKKLLTVL